MDYVVSHRSWITVFELLYLKNRKPTRIPISFLNRAGFVFLIYSCFHLCCAFEFNITSIIPTLRPPIIADSLTTGSYNIYCAFYQRMYSRMPA
jgi:hypothetical protein